jgi:histidyl-tRNA synthetase
MIQAIRGTKDILPDVIAHWYYVEETAKKVSELFGYKEIRTPIFEKKLRFSLVGLVSKQILSIKKCIPSY